MHTINDVLALLVIFVAPIFVCLILMIVCLSDD